MKKFNYGNFRIFDHKEMAKYFMDDISCGAKRNLCDVMPNNVEISEVDLLKLKIELLREGYELELIENNDGNALIAEKAYSQYLLNITPKLEEFFKMLSNDAEQKDAQSENQVEKYRYIITNITDKIKKVYGEYNLKGDLHKEKLNRYQRSMEENKNILSNITKKCEDDIKEFDKRLKEEQIKISGE